MKTVAIALLLAAMSAPAGAATAFMVDCRIGTSVTGQSILIGTYNYAGQTFQRTFPSGAGWCPMSVEVY